MMNQKLTNFILGEDIERVVSDERLEEIFSVPRTAELFEKIVTHQNYKKMFYEVPKVIGKILKEDLKTITQSIDRSEKDRIIQNAMRICAQEGILFDEAVQKEEENFLKMLDEMTGEEIQSYIDEAEAIIKIIQILG